MMKKTIMLFTIPLIVCSCVSVKPLTYQQISAHSWYTSTKMSTDEMSRFKLLTAPDYAEVVQARRQQVISQLSQQAFIEIDLPAANRLCGDCFQQTDSTHTYHYYVVRALRSGNLTGGFYVSVADGHVVVSQMTLGKIYQLEQSALVIRLEKVMGMLDVGVGSAL